MARSLNKVMLIGNLGADPEIKYTPNGTAVANLRIATSDNRKNKDGEWEERTEWHRVVMYGRQAELCKDYLKKGSKVYIDGRLETRSWEDQNGQKHYATDIVGNNLILLDARPQGQGAGPNDAPSGKKPSAGRGDNQVPSQDFPQEEDDLPF
ncbi:MAG: single-stranded DNA-binding protein [Candidatus Latescibacterota bacterium]|jgi:single-strand DNA-binding protein